MPKTVKKFVDPATGMPSTAANAILYKPYNQRQKKVDPETGMSSTSANAILYTPKKEAAPVKVKPNTTAEAILNNGFLQNNNYKQSANVTQQSEENEQEKGINPANI